MAMPVRLPYAVGNNDVRGELSGSAPSPSMSATGTVRADGTLTAAAPVPSINGTAAAEIDGTIELTAPAPTVAGTAAAEIDGTLAVTAPVPTVAGAGRMLVDGTFEAVAPVPTFSGTATAKSTATLDATAPLPEASFVMMAESAGDLAAVAPMAIVLLTDADREYAFPTYMIEVDWNNDGDWSDGNEDITDDVAALAGVAIQYGRDASKALAPSAGGSADMELDNVSGKYTPMNEVSPLFGLLLPGRPVRMRVTIGPSTYSLFYGHTDDSPLDPDISEQSVSLSMLDGLAKLRGQTVSTSLYRGIRTGEAIGYVLDAVGWPVGMRDLNMGATVMPWWWCADTDAYDALIALVNSEGPPALLSVGANGEIVFRDRHHRLLTSEARDVQAYWSAQEHLVDGSKVSLSWSDVINHVSFEVSEREPDAELSEVFKTEDVLTFTAGETQVLRVSAADPFTGAVTPVAGVDYTLVSGEVSVVVTRTSGQRTEIQVTASVGGPATVLGMALRAYAVPTRRTWVVQSEDTTSIAKYGRRSWPEESAFASVHDARAISALILDGRADPLPTLTARMVATSGSELAHQVARDLSDRVEIADHVALGGQWFINAISHRFDGRVGHETVFTCEEVRPIGGTEEKFTLGSATDGIIGTSKVGRIASVETHNVLIMGSATNGVIGTNRLGF